MPVSVRWGDEGHTLINAAVEGHPETKEYYEVEEKFRTMLHTVSYPVDVIVDLSKQVYFSPHYLENVENLRGFDHPNIRSLIFLGNPMAWELFLVYVRTHGGIPYQYAFAETPDAANELVRRVRAGKKIVPDVPPPSNWN